jgi:hypothetical protein
MTDKEKLVLGPLYPDSVAAERRAFLDKAALAALPKVVYYDGLGERYTVEATDVYAIAALMLRERDRRHAEEAKS